MPQRYVEAILKYLADRRVSPLKPRQLARQLGVSDEDYGTFREAVKGLRDAGRVVMGTGSALMLPAMTDRVVGFFRQNPRGFGFIVPEQPNAHGDLYVPAEATGGAMTGDLVVAQVQKRGRRDGQKVYGGRIIEVRKRAKNQFVGTLARNEGTWFVMPDGAGMIPPIVVADVGEAGPKPGAKVVAEIVQYPERGDLPKGVIVETLGEQGEMEVETTAVIRAHGLTEQFGPEALADARRATEQFDSWKLDGREDLTDETVVTIDPADARDFDDAISLAAGKDGTVTLGVHITDVSHFIREGSALDEEARRRGTSVYFPRKVIPMLPEVLSNGICSLQPGERRYCKSVLITYDADAKVVARRFVDSVIRSSKRLTYRQAQNLCDGNSGKINPKVVALVREMEALARRIQARRRQAGMLSLDLPEARLVFDDANHVIDAAPVDNSYTHTVIEMFMVEANEAVSELLTRLDRRHLRRIHPDPAQTGGKELAAFVRACGHRIAVDLTRRDIQDLLARVQGRPESYAVNLAVLKTFEQAQYSPMQIGHFALASRHYCHFTSPIRRYPDLTVHRLLTEHIHGRLDTRPPEDLSALTQLGEDCTAAERRAKAAEEELREVLVLQLLATKVGESFDGVITGVTNFGIFVQSPRFLIEGLVRLADLGDDWWDVAARYGQIRGQRSGKVYRIGDILPVRILGVDVARRQLNLLPEPQKPKPKAGKKAKRSAGKGGKRKGKAKRRGPNRPGKAAP